MEGFKFNDGHSIPDRMKQGIAAKDDGRHNATLIHDNNENPGKGNDQAEMGLYPKLSTTISNGMQIEKSHSFYRFGREKRSNRRSARRERMESKNRKK